MADLFSDVLTIRDTKGGISDASTYSGWQRVSKALIEITSEPALNELLHFIDLPSTDKPTSIKLVNTQIDSAPTVVISIGIYAGAQFTKSDGTIVLKNEAISPTAFVTVGTFFQTSTVDSPQEIRFDSTGTAAALINSDLSMWELAGLTEDPTINMRISAEIVNAFGTYTNGDVVMICNSSYK